ncbi:MAG: MFS transporter [Betaproteobacteria bacterium RIFCSPLOWO2_02_FULL_67_26]|nr:MAG: MFS transporter [Betaproteobacteria bacterium RIFCSPLOWO2_02_FULL_67_26]
MDRARKNVAVLAVCQGLLFTNNSVLITVNALAGYALAANKALATLPVTAYFVGSALAALPLSYLMKRHGRRAGFTLGAVFAILGSLICAAAVYAGNFVLLCGGVLVLGAYFAAGQYYRFAAADAVSPDFKSQAISLVLAGGIAGGFLGPETSKATKDLLAGHAFAGAYFSLVIFALLSILVLRWLDIPALTAAERKEAGRPLGVIARQPAFLIAVLCGTVSYGVMNLLMTATPLAMVAHEHPFSDAAFVIQWHIVGMFAPSFFTGALIQRVGLMTVLLAGVALNVVCVAIALSGLDVMHFWFALVLLGVGWNFMFVGATTLLTECHAPAERAKVQGVNDSAIFVVMAISSLSSGALFTLQGWQTMNVLAVPFLLLAGAGILWLASIRRGRPRPAA